MQLSSQQTYSFNKNETKIAKSCLSAFLKEVFERHFESAEFSTINITFFSATEEDDRVVTIKSET